MNLSIKTHIGPNGVLHIEGLDQIADQDVTVTVSLPATFVSPIEFDLEQYAAPTVGSEVAPVLWLSAPPVPACLF